MGMMDELPDDGAQELHGKVCSYCNVENPFNGKGDHVVNGEIRKKFPELDNLVYRLNCCRSCNSSKQDKDMIEWWVGHRKEDVTKLTKDHLNVYCRAMWKYCKLSDTLDDPSSEHHIKAIEQLHEKIGNPSYDIIWTNLEP